MTADIARLRMEADSSSLRTASKDLGNLSKDSKSAEGRITGLGRSMLKLAGATIGIAAVKSQFSAINNELMTLEKNMLRTDAIIQATGATAGFSAEQLREQARQLAFATLESTESIMQAQQVLKTFRSVSADVFTRATEAAMDLATVTGQSLNGSMTQLGKALEDPVQGLNSLRRSGVSFTDSQKDMIRSLQESGDLLGAQNIILDELAQQYGGVARAEAEGLAGAQDTLGQSIQELRLAIGDFLGTGDRMANTFNWISAQAQEFTAFIASGQITYYLQAIGQQFYGIYDAAQDALQWTMDLVKDAAEYWGVTGSDGVGFITRAFAEMVPNIKAFIQIATVELLVLVDKSKAYGQAIAQYLDPRNWLDGQSMGDYVEAESKRIEAVRLASISAIIDERNATVLATQEKTAVILEQGALARREWEMQQAELAEFAWVAGDTARIVMDAAGATDELVESTKNLDNVLKGLMRTFGDEMTAVTLDYAKNMDDIRMLEESGMYDAITIQDLRLAAYEKYQEDLTAISERETQRRLDDMQREADMAAKLNEQKLNAAGQFFGNMAQVMSAGGEKSFKAYKRMATAEAMVAGSLAFMKALGSAPPPFNFAAAASVALVTGKNIADIQSMQYQRAMGGQVPAGASVLVGERGPEVLQMGAQGGYVTPNHQISKGDGVSVTNVFQVSTGVAETVQAELMEMAPSMIEMSKQAIIQAINSGGAMTRAVGRRA